MLEELDAEWRDETSQPMPRGIDEVIFAARMAGFTAGEAEAGDYTLAAVHRQAVAAKKLADDKAAEKAADRRELAAEIAKKMAAIDPNLAIDQWERILSQISIEAKKTLVSLRQLAAISRDQPARRNDISDFAGLSADQLRRVLERELPYVGVELIGSRTGPHGGIWLTHEGAIVADRIEPQILPTKKSSPPKNSIRHIVRA